jgi:hypothetical protein
VVAPEPIAPLQCAMAAPREAACITARLLAESLSIIQTVTVAGRRAHRSRAGGARIALCHFTPSPLRCVAWHHGRVAGVSDSYRFRKVGCPLESNPLRDGLSPGEHSTLGRGGILQQFPGNVGPLAQYKIE